jgi:hypothetical protein
MSTLPGSMARFETVCTRTSLFLQHCVSLYCFTAVQLGLPEYVSKICIVVGVDSNMLDDEQLAALLFV